MAVADTINRTPLSSSRTPGTERKAKEEQIVLKEVAVFRRPRHEFH
jgi:hypothetical protein